MFFKNRKNTLVTAVSLIIAVAFVMLWFSPVVSNTGQTAVTGNESVILANGAFSSNSFNAHNVSQTYLQLGGTNITIYRENISRGTTSGFATVTKINGTISSWTIYQNNLFSGIVSLEAMYYGHVSSYVTHTNESNSAGVEVTTNITNHTLASQIATATSSDAKYSIGLFGWAASFSESELGILNAYFFGGATLTTFIALIIALAGVSGGVGAAIAGAIIALGAVVIYTLYTDCGNDGGYIGTTWLGSFVVGCNPVPWGY
ncbi:MAG: hypothetical protein B2I17_00165 [Thermoplasmatales archaeon B_DKE]|nr:MAG: hypothetical protein B2I17_00165 [Thermoplasmatales archaeon B_DKE]